MATVDEMKSRWVYSELGSPRWGEAYAQLRGHTPLLEKATLHVPFSSLTADEREQLLEYAPNSSRRGLMGAVEQPSFLSPRALDQDPAPRDRTRPTTMDRFRSTSFSRAGRSRARSRPTLAKRQRSSDTTPTNGKPRSWSESAATTCFSTATPGASRTCREAPASAKLAVWVPGRIRRGLGSGGQAVSPIPSSRIDMKATASRAGGEEPRLNDFPVGRTDRRPATRESLA